MSVVSHIILWPFIKIIELLWWLFKKCLAALFAIFVGICVVILVLLIFPNTWLPVLVDKYIENRTGFSVHIEESKCNLFRGHFEFHNVLLINPAHRYPVDHALSMEVLDLDIKPSCLWKNLWESGELVFPNIYLDMDDLTIVRNAQGDINFIEFFDKLGGVVGNTASPDSHPDFTDDNPETVSNTLRRRNNNSINRRWRIEQLTLHLDSLRWKDFKSEKPQEQSFELFYRHQWRQVIALQEITSTILADFKPYGISLLLQSIFNSFLDIPGISHAHNSLKALRSLGKGILSGVQHKVQAIFTKTKTTTDTQ
ncbi:MAG: hypothetical protein LBD40_00475 [Puniceicoccales bacterium]|jgi:hypothetical protein|nr:hypothetical protein [Puniceicoccales bacterium]